MLRDYDLDMLHIIAGRWDVDLPAGDARAAAAVLSGAMLAPDAAGAVWARLGDAERGALQTLHGSGGQMTAAQFGRIFGEIREMGPTRRKKETPYLDPISLAEQLYYRGLIAQGFDQNEAGVIQAHIYIPSNLRDALPFTAAETEASLIQPAAPPPAPVAAVEGAAVDDLTTLLAYVQTNPLGTLRGADHVALRPHLRGSGTPARLDFLLGAAAGMGLVAPQADGGDTLHLVRAPARAWLEAPRAEQLRRLVRGWYESTQYQDLRHVPGLTYEEGGAPHDPTLARQAVFHFLAALPPGEWWSLDAFIAMMKEEAPDFQRPTGDWESWYIRDAEGGGYLHGFESWDRVDGALVRHILTGPMHWLALTEIGGDREVFHVNETGLAALGLSTWEQAPDPPAALEVQAGGTVKVPHTLSRYDRFQLARVAEWQGAAGDMYTYTLTPASLRRAAAQGVTAAHVRAFLRRASGEDLPEALAAALERWEAGGEPVLLHRPVVLQTDSFETMERLKNEPQINRCLGRPLGPAAVVVRPGMWRALRDALHHAGVLAEVKGLDEIDEDPA